MFIYRDLMLVRSNDRVYFGSPEQIGVSLGKSDSKVSSLACKICIPEAHKVDFQPVKVNSKEVLIAGQRFVEEAGLVGLNEGNGSGSMSSYASGSVIDGLGARCLFYLNSLLK